MREREFFGTDGIRGTANVHPMTVEVALKLGRAVAHYFRQNGRKQRVVVGKDTRRSCYMFETAIAAGVCSMGADCWLTGPLPTPAIAHLASTMRADAGIVISASHNPYHDNGIKIFARDGFKLPDETELELEALMTGHVLDEARASAHEVGRVVTVEGVRGRYVAFVKNTFPQALTLDGLRIVVDCANGAAYKVAPTVLEELGATVFPIGVQPNGFNINEACGALHLETLQNEVLSNQAHIGIALDGDADRVIMVDEHGSVIDGDAIMALIAKRMLAEKKLKQNTLVVTVMSNIGLERCIQSLGGKIVRTGVGDRYVVDEMRRGGYSLGGEQSGHLIFLDYATTGDGLVGALQVLAAMVQEGRPVSELAAIMTRYPQVLVNVRVDQRKPIESLSGVMELIASAEKQLSGEGRVLVRYSGTEPKARVMVEGPREEVIKTMANEIAAALELACRKL